MQTHAVYIHEILPREFVVSVFLGVGGWGSGGISIFAHV